MKTKTQYNPISHTSNTTYERHSLDQSINLSDAHCRQPLSESQLKIVEQFPELFIDAMGRSQTELEKSFLAAFLRLAGEPEILDTSRYMFTYSASCAITMVASYCARNKKRVALIEPAFDNIPSILRREGVELVPIPESECTSDQLPAAVDKIDPAVIWLVSPNNPTGWSLSEGEFREVVQACATNDCMLVLDTSFRFFDAEMFTWSMYEILEDADISYLVLEDTGKTWSTSEIKVGLTVCSKDMYADMYRLHDDLLQSVSPFHLRALKEFIENSIDLGPPETILPYIRNNRDILRSTLPEDIFEFMTALDSPVSVDWLRISNEFDSEELVQAAIQNGVHVLPGTNFFWSAPERGREFIRIPLARDPRLVSEGARLLSETARRAVGEQRSSPKEGHSDE